MRKGLSRLMAVLGIACLAASCTTAYDAYGRPQQVVTPEGAALGAVAAGLIGYALNDDNDNYHGHHNRHYGGGGYYGSGHYGGYPSGGRCY